MKISILVAFASIPFLGLAACSSPAASNAGAATSDSTEEQSGIDVQLLQIWTPGRVVPQTGSFAASTYHRGPQDVMFDSTDPTVCPITQSLPASPGWTNSTVDCTGAVVSATPFDGTGVPGPLLTPVSFNVNKPSVGPSQVDPDYCNRVEARVVVRDDSASQPSFVGVGFWTSRGESLTAKADLQAVGHVTLTNGDAATVYRFAGISTCISGAHNSTSGNMFQTYSLKPYAAYGTTDPSGTLYRVWDANPGNYTIGKSWPDSTPVVNTDSIDRQADILKQN